MKHMEATMKTTTHPEAHVTNQKIIKLIMLDALGQQGKTWKQFKRERARTNQGKQTTISGGS